MFDAPMPSEVAVRLQQVQLAQEFGWTLEYVDSLDEFVRVEIFGILDGIAKFKKWKSEHP